MTEILESSRGIPVLDEVDVLVVGGGTAGPAAGIAAARHGARTLLIDRAGWLGGNLIGGATGFHGFWNVYHREPGRPKVKIVEGIPQEIVDRCLAAGASVGHVEFTRSLDFNSVYTGLEPERTRIVLYDMVAGAGCRVLLHVTAAAARTAGDRHVVIVQSKAGRQAIVARQVIDCTGDGDVAAALGAPCKNFAGEWAWGTSLTFRIANMRLEEVLPFMEANGQVRQICMGRKIGGRRDDDVIRMTMRWGDRLAEEAKAAGIGGGMICNSLRPNEVTYCNCTWRPYRDNLDPADLTDSEVVLRKAGQAYTEFLRRHVAGCEDAFVCSHSPTLGVRLSRIFRTEYEIPRSDVLDGRHHDDAIGFVSFVDMPDYWIANAGCFGIPYRSIVPLGVENLLLAGRMISTDRVVFQTTRNTVACVEEGQAAGTAAALCVARGLTPRRLDPRLLREAIAADGAKVACPELRPAQNNSDQPLIEVRDRVVEFL